MIVEEIGQLVEKEVERRSEELLSQLECQKKQIHQLLNEKAALLEEAKKTSTIDIDMNIIGTIRSLANEKNIRSVLSIFSLKQSNMNIHGMDTETMPIWFHLLIEYYEDRTKLFQLLTFFNIDFPEWAPTLRFPQDYNEEEVLYFVQKNLSKRYVTNGCIFDGNLGFYWRAVCSSRDIPLHIMTKDNSFGRSIPWQLFLKNPLLLQPHIFKEVLKQINADAQNSCYFFDIQKYQLVPDELIEQLMEAVPSRKDLRIYRDFIQRNRYLIQKNPSIALLFEDEMNGNDSSTFYYLNYPIDMQKNFILTTKASLESKITFIRKMAIPGKEKVAFMHELIDIYA